MPAGTIYLTEASSGAPALSGTNGALVAVLDWALVQKGCAIEYTGSNARVYRPGAGNRHRLYVAHDSAISGDARLATVRGCENASSVTSLTDPFPTVAQKANNLSTVCVSTLTTSAARPYRIIMTDRFLLLATCCGGVNTQLWDLFMFGDLYGADPADTYATVCHIGDSNTNSTTTGRGMAGAVCSVPAPGKTFFARSIDTTQKSTYGCCAGQVNSSTASTFCANGAQSPAMRAGYNGRIVREKVGVHCTGANTTTPNTIAVNKRGWVPNLWNPLHSGIGTVTSDDTFADTAYSASASFLIAPASTAIAAILETTDTWSVPSG